VLIAEDSADNLFVVDKILNNAGVKVDFVENGKDAVEYARANNYDAVLMDLAMPVMDGYEATKELRRTGYTGKIVALTAHALVSDRERCLANGFDEHLSKPVSREALIRALAESK
jgi:two-component system, sensor histidine kinase